MKTAPTKATTTETTEPTTRRSARWLERNGCNGNERDKSFSEHENLP
jgi:hypothetical protein